MSQFIKFHFTSSLINMFRTFIHPSSGACDFSIVSPHWLCVLVSMCVGVSEGSVGVVSVWQASAFSLPYGYHIGCMFLFRCVLEFRCGWVGVVSVWQASAFSLPHGYHPNSTTPKLQHTSKQEHTTNVVIQ